jgi:hypothetical protein
LTVGPSIFDGAAAIVSEGESCPVGRRGSPIAIPRGTNQPGEVGGIQYTGHAFDQMQGRGIPPYAVQNTIENGIPSPGYDGATVYSGDGFNVSLNPDNSVKTVIPR